MIHRVADNLTMCLVRNDYIDVQLQAICQYKLERVLRTGLFMMLALLIALPTHCCEEAAFFIAASYLCRRRMGGFHISSPAICLICSLGIVFLNTLVIGPSMQKIPPATSLGCALLSDALIFFLPPAYPRQLHFTKKEADANIQRKKCTALFLSVLQIAAFLANKNTAILYMLIGTLFAVVTIMVSYVKNCSDRVKSHTGVDQK